MLVADQVGFAIDDRPLLREINLALQAGEVLGLIGPNGAGKSTLVNLLAGLSQPTSGRILLQGHEMASLSATQRARTIAYLPQHPHVHWSLTVADVVALGRIPHMGRFASLSTSDAAVVSTVIEHTELTEFVDRRVDELSGGELMRVMIARLLAVDAKCLIADEPIAGLDPYFQLEVLDLFRTEAQRGCSALLVLHDLSLAARYCDRLALLQQGRLVALGRPDEVLTTQRIESVYRVSMDASTGRHFIPDKRL